MVQKPKISIITISYNSFSTIERTIRSIIEQEYANKEYIVIDGGSTDGTNDIIWKYKDYISHFVSEKDTGISNAFNKGIRRATGDLIVCINSDDYLLPNVLNEVALLFDGQHDIYCGNLVLWDSNTDAKSIIRPSLKFPTMPFFCKPVHQGMFITKDLYEKIGVYDEQIKYAMDLDLLMRASKNQAKFKYMNIDIAVFLLGGATEDSIFKKRKEYIYIVRKNGGNIIQANIFYYFLIITQTTKKLLKKTGVDWVRKIRYPKYS